MTDEQQTQLQRLLRLAKTRPLTDEEKEMFQELLQADKGNIAAEQHLQDHYRATGRSRTWSKQELREVARQIEKKAGTSPKSGRWQNNVRRLSGVAAMLVATIGLLWLWTPPSRPVMEPAAPVSELIPTPEPTPTLNALHKYADLSEIAPPDSYTLQLDDYALSLEQAAAEFGEDLYLPNQVPESWVFAGAAVTQQTSGGQPIVELAFVQRIGASENLWILAQATAVDIEATEPLSMTYQPLATVDQRLNYEDQMVEIGDYSGRGLQYELVDRTNSQISWVVYNTVTWQQEETVLTLAIVYDNLFPTTTVAATADKMALSEK